MGIVNKVVVGFGCFSKTVSTRITPFEGAICGLPEMMAGRLDSSQVKEFLMKYGFWENAGQKFYVVYKQINTGGGAYIEGDVNIQGGDFIGRDKIITS